MSAGRSSVHPWVAWGPEGGLLLPLTQPLLLVLLLPLLQHWQEPYQFYGVVPCCCCGCGYGELLNLAYCLLLLLTPAAAGDALH